MGNGDGRIENGKMNNRRWEMGNGELRMDNGDWRMGNRELEM